ncbi:hypothetical protein Rhal01_01777 [Rubritalea halochordaticola]|uniref:Ice-binding protein C-terminal domain-containing protein n=1 Tax=Rubritalea halochordaticola TaxID=714537 RepID=A0ABP9UZF0_9BACT
MKTPITLLTVVTGLITSANAATTFVISAQNNANTTTTVGSVSNNTIADDTDLSTNPTFTYTVTGLDIDGIGGNNDEVVIVLAVSGTTSADPAYIVTNPSNGNWMGIGGAGDNSVDQGETFTFSLISASTTLNGTTAGTAIFDGFLGGSIGKSGTANGNFTVNGETFNMPNATTDITLADQSQSVYTIATVDSGAGGADNIRPFSWDFQITADTAAVPEPSSTSLLSLAGLGLILRRRRA